MTDLESLRYPIGRFEPKEALDPSERDRLIEAIASLPVDLRDALAGLDEERLDTSYREGGWTVRQVVHHIPDSHMNGYLRMKLAVTEDRPTLITYQQAVWAEQSEARTAPIDVSLDLLEALHRRWTLWLLTLDEAKWKRVGVHPDWGDVSVEVHLQVYAWHGRHHLAHITSLREREGWT